jgi:hypothetical protein
LVFHCTICLRFWRVGGGVAANPRDRVGFTPHPSEEIRYANRDFHRCTAKIDAVSEADFAKQSADRAVSRANFRRKRVEERESQATRTIHPSPQQSMAKARSTKN